MLPGSGPGSGRAPGSGLKTMHFLQVLLMFFVQNVDTKTTLYVFALNLTQKLSFGLKFASQVIILRGVSQNIFFLPVDAAEGRGTAHVTSSCFIIQKQNPKC